jgi:hypothetical protein
MPFLSDPIEVGGLFGERCGFFLDARDPRGRFEPRPPFRIGPDGANTVVGQSTLPTDGTRDSPGDLDDFRQSAVEGIRRLYGIAPPLVRGGHLRAFCA